MSAAAGLEIVVIIAGSIFRQGFFFLLKDLTIQLHTGKVITVNEQEADFWTLVAVLKSTF